MEYKFHADTAGVADADLLIRLKDAHTADIVTRLNDMPVDDAATVLKNLPQKRAVDVFDTPELNRAGALLLTLPGTLSDEILKNMADDRAADILQTLDVKARNAVLRHVGTDCSGQLKRLLAYSEDTAGGLMTTEFVSVPAGFTVAQTLSHIRAVESTRETVYAIYVLDPQSRVLIRVVSLRQLIMADPDTPVETLSANRAPVMVRQETDREEVSRLISVHDLLAVPVVDEEHHVLGIVTVDDVIDTIVAESSEDVQKFGGVEGEFTPYLTTGFFTMYRKRVGWLCALFIGEMLTASAMQHFENELARAVVLTLFIPLIMSSGGNSGSQATSLLIRALALGELRLRDWWKVALRELPTGLGLGVSLGIIALLRITAWQMFGIYDYGTHWGLIALTVGTGLVGIVTFGSLAGSMLPFALKRLGFDPASASAPFVATLVDVTGLVIYFLVALVILHGTLL